MPVEAAEEITLTPERIREIDALVWEDLRKHAPPAPKPLSQDAPCMSGEFGDGWTGDRVDDDTPESRADDERAQRDAERKAAERRRRQDAFFEAAYSADQCTRDFLEAVALHELPYRLRRRRIELKQNHTSPLAHKGVSDAEWRAFVRHVCERTNESDDENNPNWYAIENLLLDMGYPRDRIDELHHAIVNDKRWAEYDGRKLKLSDSGRRELDRLRGTVGRGLGEYPPWLREIARRVDVLISAEEARRRFRDHVERWARVQQAEERKGFALDDNRALTLDECYVHVAAVHDALSQNTVMIDPFPQLPVVVVGEIAAMTMAYCVLMDKVSAIRDGYRAQLEDALHRVESDLKSIESSTSSVESSSESATIRVGVASAAPGSDGAQIRAHLPTVVDTKTAEAIRATCMPLLEWLDKRDGKVATLRDVSAELQNWNVFSVCWTREWIGTGSRTGGRIGKSTAISYEGPIIWATGTDPYNYGPKPPDWFAKVFEADAGLADPQGLTVIRLTETGGAQLAEWRIGCSSSDGHTPKRRRRKARRRHPFVNVMQPSKSRGARPELVRLSKETPAFNRDDGNWLCNKLAATEEGVATRTLATYRQHGIMTPDKCLGRDRDGRVWRRIGTPSSHPWYLRSSPKNISRRDAKP